MTAPITIPAIAPAESPLLPEELSGDEPVELDDDDDDDDGSVVLFDETLNAPGQ